MVAQETSSGVVMRVFNSLSGLLYRPVCSELDRRRGVGLGALAQLPLLDGLLGFPAGLPVAWSELTLREQQLVAAAPTGVLRRQGGFVLREAVPPLVPQLAGGPGWSAVVWRGPPWSGWRNDGSVNTPPGDSG